MTLARASKPSSASTYLVPALAQEDLGAAPDGVAVVDDEHPGAGRARHRLAGVDLGDLSVQAQIPFKPGKGRPEVVDLRGGRVRHAGSRKTDPRAVRQEARPGSDLDHFEVFLARAALGTGPVHGDVGPGRACRHAVFGVAHGFVVDPAANQAHPGTRFAHGGTVTSLQWIGIVATPLGRKAGFDGCLHAVSKVPLELRQPAPAEISKPVPSPHAARP